MALLSAIKEILIITAQAVLNTNSQARIASQPRCYEINGVETPSAPLVIAQ
jgi:hypothetical protein